MNIHFVVHHTTAYLIISRSNGAAVSCNRPEWGPMVFVFGNHQTAPVHDVHDFVMEYFVTLSWPAKTEVQHSDLSIATTVLWYHV